MSLRHPATGSVPEILERVLDKGIVIQAWVGIAFAGVDIVTVDLRVIVASLDTYLRYTRESGDLAPAPTATSQRSRRSPARDAMSLRVVQQAFDALNGHDADAYAALLDSTYIGETHRLPLPVRGRDAARQSIEAYLRLLPDLHFTIEGAVATGDDVLVSWVATGTPRGDFRGAPLAIRPLSIPGCTVTRVRGRKIAHAWNYWDTPTARVDHASS